MLLLRLYRDSFAGLSPAIWWLALITLINRSGTMVLPFLTIYLTQALDFSLQQAGWVMSCFSLGSVAGSYLGGYFTDRVGYYRVMFWTLFLSGGAFLLLMLVKTMLWFCLAVFLLSLIADGFRPASMASIAAYAKPENRTRSLSLIRMAINTGWSIGPAVGGFLAAYAGYNWLFWVDGLTCMGAALLFRWRMREAPEASRPAAVSEAAAPAKGSPYRDRPFLLFLAVTALVAIAFFQLFATLPVFYKQEYLLNEDQIGWLMAFNGILIVILEMPMVYLAERRFSKLAVISAGAFFIGLSYVAFNFWPGWLGVLVLGMALLTIGEILDLPFTNAVALERSDRGSRGQYMALYTISFSAAHILAPVLGMQIAAQWGFATLWYLLGGICLLGILGYHWLAPRLEADHQAG